jgi:16S rRNA (cytidine1402-2'-O)-methyltransferase
MRAMAGQLWLVPTPIGHLGDMTLRAVERLREVDGVLAEDTRRARALLTHFEVHGKPVHRLDARREREGATHWAGRIAAGERLALLSDAGTPGVSDPGSALVRACAAAGVAVQALPGPSAVTTAAAVSGLCSGGFCFVGFLPRSGGERARALEQIAQRPEATILFESARRLARLLEELAQRAPRRELCVCRELSKLHEQILRGTAADLGGGEAREWRGEVTLVLGPQAEPAAPRWSEAEVDRQLAQLAAEGRGAKDSARLLAASSGWGARELYARACATRRSPPSR